MENFMYMIVCVVFFENIDCPEEGSEECECAVKTRGGDRIRHGTTGDLGDLASGAKEPSKIIAHSRPCDNVADKQ